MRKFLLSTIILFHVINCVAQKQEMDSLTEIIGRGVINKARVGALSRMAAFYAVNKVDTALAFAMEALTIAREKQWPLEEAKALNGMGGVCWAIGDFVKALDFYFQALKLAEQEKDDRFTANLLGNLGNVYADMGD